VFESRRARLKTIASHLQKDMPPFGGISLLIHPVPCTPAGVLANPRSFRQGGLRLVFHAREEGLERGGTGRKGVWGEVRGVLESLSAPSGREKRRSGENVKFSKICVLGLGYIGLPTAGTFATCGVKVVGVDVNPVVVETLRNGDLHIREPGLRTIVQAAFQSGNLTVQPRPEEADAFIIAVPTPIHADKTADLAYVTSAAESIRPLLRTGNLVVLESTSPPRTTQDVVRPILEGSGLTAGRDFLLAYSPERVLPGQILRELIENARVIGGVDRASAEAGRDLYGMFVRGEIVLTDATTAETVKLMENTFRDVNIALANELLRLAEAHGVDIWEAIAVANRHPRVDILRPGPGVGGHCISVDPWFLVESNPALTPLIRTAREINDSQPEYLVQYIERITGELSGRKIAVFGLTYKADVDDVRESPALEVVRLLDRRGAKIAAYDGLAPAVPFPGERSRSAEEAADKADVLLLLVGHRELCDLDPAVLRRRMRTPLAIDCQHVWSRTRWEESGFTFLHFGDARRRGPDSHSP
jgi:UDP-N-acetyl-D-mannosaminuronic acid dehydrogenase